jgi:hypothetical protein
MAAKPKTPSVTGEIVRQFFHDIEDHTILAILALEPTPAQLEEAVVRLSGTEEIFADLRPETGVVAQIVELIREERALDEENAAARGA